MILFEDCIGTYGFEEMSRRNWRAWASFQYSLASSCRTSAQTGGHQVQSSLGRRLQSGAGP